MPVSGWIYRDLLTRPGVGRVILAAALSRLTTSMVSLSLLLAVVQRDGSYAQAGAVLAAHAFALAAMAPVNGRVADRLGPRAAMLAYTALHAAAYLSLLFALVSASSAAAVVACAVFLGASTPPAAPVTRALWPLILPKDRLQAAYAVDSVLNSTMLVAGPLIAAALMLAVPAVFVIVVAGIVKVSGDLVLATAPVLRRAAPPRVRLPGLRHMLGPIADSRLRLLLLIMALDTFTYGCLQVGAAAIAGGQSAAGVLFAALAAGEVLGGLIYGARTWQGGPKAQFAALHLVTAALLVTAGQFLAVLVAVGLYLLLGLAGGARDVVGQLAIGGAAKAAQRAEAFAWLTTAMWGGYGIGTLVAGYAQTGLGLGAVFLAAALVSVLAAGVALLLR